MLWQPEPDSKGTMVRAFMPFADRGILAVVLSEAPGLVRPSASRKRRDRHEVLIPLGDRGLRRIDDVCRHRGNVLTRGLPAAHVGGYRVVAHGHIDRHDSRFSRHGGCGVWLGRGKRQARAAGGGDVRGVAARTWAGARELFNLAAAVPTHLRVIVGLAGGAFFAPMI